MLSQVDKLLRNLSNISLYILMISCSELEMSSQVIKF